MTKRTSIYALAAVAALGITALATSSASAYVPHGPMGVKVQPHGPMGVSIKPKGPVVTGIVIKKPPVVKGSIIKPKPQVVTGINIHKPYWPHHNWCRWHYCGPNWVVGAGVGVVATGAIASAPVAARPAAPCTCLTKTYLQDGSVLFKDVCTNEAAVATPDQKAAN